MIDYKCPWEKCSREGQVEEKDKRQFMCPGCGSFVGINDIGEVYLLPDNPSPIAKGVDDVH